MSLKSSCAVSLGALIGSLSVIVAAPAQAASAPAQSDAVIFLVQPATYHGSANDAASEQAVLDGLSGGSRYGTNVRVDGLGDDVAALKSTAHEAHEQKSEEESILDVAMMLVFAAVMLAYPLIRKQRSLLHTSVLTTYV